MYEHWASPWRYHDPSAVMQSSVLRGEREMHKQALSCSVLSSSTGVSTGDARCKRGYMASTWGFLPLPEGFAEER